MPHTGAHDGHIERRNYPTRAQVLCHIVNRLMQAADDSTAAAACIPDEVAERILRRLACRGLVRREAGVWRPTPILLHPAHLVPCWEPAP